MKVRARAVVGALGLAIATAGCQGAEAGGPARVRPTATTVGFLFVGARNDLGYNQAAWEGSEAVARALPDAVVLRRENVPETVEAEHVMDDLIKRGARILFPTSFGYLPFAIAVARRHPGVVVVHEGGLEPSPPLDNFGTYFGTVYEPVYEGGIAAGLATRTNTLGFIAAFPIPATFNNINAFALGAQSVNPAAVVQVRFTGAWCDPDRQATAAASLLAAGADVLTQHQDCTATILRAAEAAGAKSVGYHYDGSEVAPKGWLIGSVWDWRGLFIDIVRSVLSGRFKTSPYNGDFRGGLHTGDNPFVLTELGPGVDRRAGPLIQAADARFRSGGSPFAGPVEDRTGRLRVAAGALPTRAEVDRMNYLVKGVAGEVPP